MYEQVFKVSILMLTYVFFVASAACKKTATSPAKPSYEINVHEYKTNKPIKGALVQTYYMHYDYMNPILDLRDKGYTDSAGDFTFDPTDINVITATYPHYWTGGSWGIGDIFMIPESTIQLRLLKKRNYPINSLLTVHATTTEEFTNPYDNIFVAEAAGVVYWEGDSFYSYNLPIDTTTTTYYLPTDTTIYLRVLGNCHNYLTWQVASYTSQEITDSGRTSPLYINPFDTAKVEVEY